MLIESYSLRGLRNPYELWRRHSLDFCVVFISALGLVHLRLPHLVKKWAGAESLDCLPEGSRSLGERKRGVGQELKVWGMVACQYQELREQEVLPRTGINLGKGDSKIWVK